MRKDDPKRNPSGCLDLTAYEAIKHLDKEQERFDKFLKTVFNICELSGFHIVGRITVRDKRTGREWR